MMINKILTAGLLCISLSGVLQADIYDDYKLLAEGISTNTAKIAEVYGELNKKIETIQKENKTLEEKITQLLKENMDLKRELGDLQSANKANDIQISKTANGSGILDDASRKELLKIIKANRTNKGMRETK